MKKNEETVKKNSEKNTKLIHVNCDFCNSDKYNLLYHSKDFLFKTSSLEFKVVKCSKCGLVFTNPRYNTEDLKFHYSKIISYDNRPLGNEINHRFNLLRRVDILTDYFNYKILKRSRIRKFIQFPNYLKIRRRWKFSPYVPRYKSNGKILEIGCAYGRFLYQLKKLGWNVKGIELNQDAVKYAINKYNLDVENISIEEFETDEMFDVIYLVNVLEHVESPKKVLTKIVPFLKPNGLLIISLPDFSGLEVRLFKKYSYCLHLPFHLYHFTPKTLNNYIEDLGLKKVKLFHLSTDREIIGPLKYILMEDPNRFIIKFIHKIITNRINRVILNRILLNFLAFIGKTSRMTMIIRKDNV